MEVLYMTTKEYMEQTGITSNKTVYWIHDKVHGNENRDSYGNRIYDDRDVKFFLDNQLDSYNGRIVQIPGYMSYYISDNGHVYINRRGFLEEISGFINFGYHVVGITNNDGIRKNIRVHRLVAEAFIPNPLNKPQVNHLDGNKLNNHYTNLEWATASENAKHAFALGLSSNDKGFNDSQSIQIVYIDNNAIMHVFGSIKSASRKLGIIASTISKKMYTQSKNYR